MQNNSISFSPKFIKSILGTSWKIGKQNNLFCLETLFNFPAYHVICFAFGKSCKCNFVRRQCNAYYGTICISINLSNFIFPNFMIQAHLGSLWNVEAHHSLGFGFGNLLECIFEMGKEYAILWCFAYLLKIEFETMSNFVKINSWNFLDKYGSTRILCFTISFEFVSREREWPK